MALLLSFMMMYGGATPHTPQLTPRSVISCYLSVAVVQRHQGGVDDLSIRVGMFALPAPDWLLGVNPVLQLLSVPAPQHHLQTQKLYQTTSADLTMFRR